MRASQDVPRFLLLLQAGETEDKKELQPFVEGDDLVDVGFERVEGVEEDVESRLEDAEEILRRLSGERALDVDEC